MMEDVAPKLLNNITEDFGVLFDANSIISDVYKKIKDGTATYDDATKFSIEVGEALVQAFKNNLSSATLPDGKMYYNIGKRVVEPLMIDDFDLVSDICRQIQDILNKKANIGIKAIKPDLNHDRIDGIINRLSSESDFDEVAWILDEPVRNFSQSIVDEVAKINAAFQYDAGLSPKIERVIAGNCCDWCKSLVGTYNYPDVPQDVYRRHDYCRCKVEFVAGKTKRNVHNNNVSQRRYVQNNYGGYEMAKKARIERAKQMSATEKERKESARQKRIETLGNKSKK